MNSKYFHSLKVSKIERQTQEAVCITLEIPDHLKADFAFVPGQYVTIKKEINGESLRRSYSICTSPDEQVLRIAVKQIEDGRFSNFANQLLKVGDELDVMQPSGKFTLSHHNEISNVVFFAAGSGITPIMSQIKFLLKNDNKTEVTLIYGNRNMDSIIFREELEALKNKYLDRLAVYHIFTKEKVGIPVFFGRIDQTKCETLAKYFFDIQKVSQYMLCGPAEMIFSVKDALINMGVLENQIHYELFNTDGLTPTNANKNESKIDDVDLTHSSKIQIKMDGDIFGFNLAYGGKNILDAALEEGADMPYACKGGVCSTCRAKVTQGEVSMDINYALEPDELAAGYVLLCQSHPRSSTIHIDFDQK